MTGTIGNDGVLVLGKDFVDCVAGDVITRGRVRITVGKRITERDYASTFPWEQARAGIRAIVRQERKNASIRFIA